MPAWKVDKKRDCHQANHPSQNGISGNEAVAVRLVWDLRSLGRVSTRAAQCGRDAPYRKSDALPRALDRA